VLHAFHLIAALLLVSCTSRGTPPTEPQGNGGTLGSEPPAGGAPGQGGSDSVEPPPPGSGDSGNVPGPDLPAGDGGTLVRRRTARVLFSGHSLLDNPMPDWVESIAQSRGDTLEWEEQIIIGAPIRIRTRGDDPNASDWPGYSQGKNRNGNGKDLLAELASPTELSSGTKYDTLLITERNDLLLAIQYENTIGYLRDYHDRVVAQNSASSSLLYQVWPEIDRANPTPWVEYVRQELYAWECVAQQVNGSLEAAGRSDRVGVIPGASALATLVERALAGDVPGIDGSPADRLGAVFEDNVHLAPAGTYLLSALHYAALFGRSPAGASAPSEVPAEQATALQNIAWDVLSRYRATATPWAHSLSECRQRLATVVCPAYFALVGGSGGSCGDWANDDSPLRPPA
jgi:hypothetical protein